MSAYAPVTSEADLEALYGQPGEASLLKVADRITPQYRRFLDASPFFTLATAGPEGLDCSPRGELGGLFRVLDDKRLAIPDRRGNNRMDSLRNIVRDPRVALLFLIPGSVTTIRMNGTAIVTVDPDLLASFETEGHEPRCVIVVTIETVYFQCARAIMRADLWNPDERIAAEELPSPGQIMQEIKAGFDGKTYDAQWPERARKSMW